MADLRKELAHAAGEAAYAAVGFAVLGFQRAQVARRRLERCGPVRAWSAQLRDLVAEARGERGTGDGPGAGDRAG